MQNLSGAPVRGVLPYRLALLLEALLFHRHVLFYPGYLFPWDFRAVHLPLATLVAESFRSGRFPLWDPFTYCGMPIAANIQAAVFYPPAVLAELLAAWLGNGALPRLLAILVVAQLVFAGLCTFALLRRLQASPGAAFLAATVFELGCFFAAQAEHMGAMQAAVWLPAIWLCIVELRDGLKLRWLAALAAALAMTVFAGLPQVALAAFASAIGLALLLWLFREAGWRLPALLPLAAIWGLVLAAVQFIPTAEFTRNSVAKYRAEWLGSGGGIPPAALLSLVVPNYWGVFDLSKFHGPIDPTFLYLYSSVLGLLLAVSAIVWKPARRAGVFAVLLGIFAFLMFGDKTPPGRAILLSLPDWIRIAIHPEYFFCVFSLSLAVLAGLGADRFLRSTRLQIIAAALIACDLILVSSGRPMNTASRAREPGFAANSIDGSRELLHQLRTLTAGSPPFRYDTASDVSFLWSSSAPIAGVPTANGCDPMAPERTIAVRRAFAPGPRWGTCYQVVNASSPVVGLMNTRVLVSVKPVEAAGYRLAAQVAGYRLYENARVLPRFFFAGAVRIARNLDEAGAMVRAPDFDPLATAVIEAPGPGLALAAGASGRIQALTYEPASVQLRTEAAESALLVATDSYYPGWRAYIDGKPAALYAADAGFRGIPVPAGRHQVEMRFVPVTLYWSGALTGGAALATLLAAFPFARRGDRDKLSRS